MLSAPVSRNSPRMSTSSIVGRGRLATPSVHAQQVHTGPVLCIVPALKRWRRRAKHHRHAQQLGPHHRDVARVVARRLLLLVAAVVFFIHDDQPRLAHRGKHRRSRADDDPRLARGGCGATALPARPAKAANAAARPPLPNAACICPAIAGVRPISGTSSSDDSARVQRAPHRSHVHGGLAAAGHAIQQVRAKAAKGHGQSQCSARASVCVSFSACSCACFLPGALTPPR